MGHPVCLQEVRESRDETLGLPYGDGRCPLLGAALPSVTNGLVSKLLATFWAPFESGSHG